MISFTIHQITDGRTVATHAGRTETGQDPCRVIAREMVEAGAEDQPWEIARDGRVAMNGPSLHWLAATVVSETDVGFTRTWWAAHPRSEPRPVLAALVERLKAAAPPKSRGRRAKGGAR